MNTVASLPDRLAMHARDCVKAADMDTDVVLSFQQVEAMADDMAEAALALASPAPSVGVGVEDWTIETVADDPNTLVINTPDGKAWIAQRGDRVFELAEALAARASQAPKAAALSWRCEHDGFVLCTEWPAIAEQWRRNGWEVTALQHPAAPSVEDQP